MNEKAGFVSWFWARRLWKTGGALYTEINWYAMPMRPSGGKLERVKLEEYELAAPSVCFFT